MSTVHLPHTDFPMKANLSQREPEQVARWLKEKLYEAVQRQWAESDAKAPFFMVDGPPYANGHIHLGHALQKILKDFIIKSKWLSGVPAQFVPGWDCHGLPIELNVEKNGGSSLKQASTLDFMKACRTYAQSQVDLQKVAFQRLGVLADWDHPYLTMDPTFEAGTIRVLKQLYEKGCVESGFRPVHWCTACGSALAEAEVEYQDKVSPAIHVAFPIESWSDALTARRLPLENAAVVIWTTTPWTLPSNQAVAVHAEWPYVLYQTGDRLFVVAEARLSAFQMETGLSEGHCLAVVEGRQLEATRLRHPFEERTVPLLLSTHVTVDAGTGCVHLAPAHGPDDFAVCRQYGIPLLNPIDARGRYTDEKPALAQKTLEEGNEWVLETLTHHRLLLSHQRWKHSYPHCWRHKKPLLFRATPQWFIQLDETGLREKALASLDKIRFAPAWGKERFRLMLQNRPDWCISRQRHWGVPLCLWTHEETGQLHPRLSFWMEQAAQVIERTGIEGYKDWYEQVALDPDLEGYVACTDTLDVWFESGVVHAVLAERLGCAGSADLYIEGSDQYRGWFNSSLLTALGLGKDAPYRQLVSTGFTVDAEGRKMSKSLGNVIAPDGVCKTLGADVLRLWVASTDYHSEVVVSDEILHRSADAYRRIRNTIRFLLANLHDFSLEAHGVPIEQILTLDQWLLGRAQQLDDDIRAGYEAYEFHRVLQHLHQFCVNDLGGFYLDIVKDRQYTGWKEGQPRRSAQTAMHHILEALLRWIAPILSFTAEEAWGFLKKEGRSPSVFLTTWYDLKSLPDARPVVESWKPMLEMRQAVNKALEAARQRGLGSGLEARVHLAVERERWPLLSRLQEELHYILLTAEVQLHVLDDLSDVEKGAFTATEWPGVWTRIVPLTEATHQKCTRCWHRLPKASFERVAPEHQGICPRCVSNLKAPGEVRRHA